MSEFVNRTKISALERANAELVAENSRLATETAKLKAEIEGLRGNDSGDMEALKEKLAEYEKREADLMEQRSSPTWGSDNIEQNHQSEGQSFSTFPPETAQAESLGNHHAEKRLTPNGTIAFLLGVLVALIAWVVSVYLKK